MMIMVKVDLHNHDDSQIERTKRFTRFIADLSLYR